MIQKLTHISLQADDFTIMGFFVTYKHDAWCMMLCVIIIYDTL